jgi:hypothetical protein
MISLRLFPFVVLVAGALGGCTGSRRADLAMEAPVVPPASVAPAAKNQPGASPAGNPLAVAGKPGETTGLERLIIRSAKLRMRVENVDEAEARLKSKVDDLGGYILEAHKTGTGDTASSQITFRVPAGRFDDALAAMQALAKLVDSKNVTGQDVTEEYVDLEAQLRNLEATRARLLTFLDKAVKVDDALAVQRALTDIQGQIERIAGRIKYLRQSAALSTIEVYLFPQSKTAVVSSEGWHPGETGRIAIRGLVEFAQFLGNALIILGIWAPVWAPTLLLVWWVKKRRKRQTGA